MALDTRGILDGALRGFDMMERHYERQDRKAERALRLPKRRILQAMKNGLSRSQAHLTKRAPQPNPPRP
ncbi:TPA: hypothetical protein ACX6SN_003251 [Photobacterium damselae]